MCEYENMIKEINRCINRINEFLNQNIRIDAIHFDQDKNTQDFSKCAGVSWNELVFPNKDSIGVYFLLGRSEKDTYAIYIGKASFSRRIGNRFWDHLTGYRYKADYKKQGKDGTIYMIEYIGSINLDYIEDGFLASSIEEYLIKKLGENFVLMNKVGNRK